MKGRYNKFVFKNSYSLNIDSIKTSRLDPYNLSNSFQNLLRFSLSKLSRKHEMIYFLFRQVQRR